MKQEMSRITLSLFIINRLDSSETGSKEENNANYKYMCKCTK